LNPSRVRPVGDAAATVEWGEELDPAANARVRALDQALAERPFRGFVEAVPTHRSLLVLFDRASTSFPEVADALSELARGGEAAPHPAALRMIPTRYGGEDGPDLADVAERCGLTEAEVVARHAAREYTAFMLGFTPGFAYLGLVEDALALARRTTPRVRVPAGSVAIAGRQTGVYPVASPGGWNLIGRTSLCMFDPAQSPPASILPGDRVRFVRVSELEAPARAAPPSCGRPGAPALEVLESGLLTTVQDGGRIGYRRLGVTTAGPMDAAAFGAVNAAVSNPPGAAALECTVAGPTLRFLATTVFAVAGADLGAVLQRSDLGEWPVPPGVRVVGRAGNVMSFSGRRSGCRAYVAIAGGIDVPLVLGSRTTDLSGGFGGFEGRPLRPGDVLGRGAARAFERPERALTLPSAAPGVVSVRVVLGPQEHQLSAESIRLFLDSTYTVGPTSDRVGCRLLGPRLEHATGRAEIVSDGMVSGSIEVPADGQPIVLTADGPTTGGYPKVATVVSADVPLLGQLVPGEGRVRFEAVPPDHARS
jgi:KipI family sensor histidine kinase inhibitor